MVNSIQIPNAKLADLETKLNSLLEEELRKFNENQIDMYPSASIDGARYKGRMDGDTLFKAICQTSPEELCNLEHLEYTLDDFHLPVTTWGTYFKTIFLLVCIFGTFYYFWRRSVRRSMNKKMTQKINDVLSHYAAMNKMGFEENNI